MCHCSDKFCLLSLSSEWICFNGYEFHQSWWSCSDWVAGGRGDRLRRGDVVDRRNSDEFSQELGLRANLVDDDDGFQIFQYGFWMWDLGGSHYDLRFFVCRVFQALCVDFCHDFEDYSSLGVLCSLKALFFTRVIIKGFKFVWR